MVRKFSRQGQLHYYIKYKGGDPRNHSWIEVSVEQYNNVSEEIYFRKEVNDAEQESEKQEKKKIKVK